MLYHSSLVALLCLLATGLHNVSAAGLRYDSNSLFRTNPGSQSAASLVDGEHETVVQEPPSKGRDPNKKRGRELIGEKATKKSPTTRMLKDEKKTKTKNPGVTRMLKDEKKTKTKNPDVTRMLKDEKKTKTKNPGVTRMLKDEKKTKTKNPDVTRMLKDKEPKKNANTRMLRSNNSFKE